MENTKIKQFFYSLRTLDPRAWGSVVAVVLAVTIGSVALIRNQGSALDPNPEGAAAAETVVFDSPVESDTWYYGWQRLVKFTLPEAVTADTTVRVRIAGYSYIPENPLTIIPDYVIRPGDSLRHTLTWEKAGYKLNGEKVTEISGERIQLVLLFNPPLPSGESILTPSFSIIDHPDTGKKPFAYTIEPNELLGEYPAPPNYNKVATITGENLTYGQWDYSACPLNSGLEFGNDIVVGNPGGGGTIVLPPGGGDITLPGGGSGGGVIIQSLGQLYAQFTLPELDVISLIIGSISGYPRVTKITNHTGDQDRDSRVLYVAVRGEMITGTGGTANCTIDPVTGDVTCEPIELGEFGIIGSDMKVIGFAIKKFKTDDNQLIPQHTGFPPSTEEYSLYVLGNTDLPDGFYEEFYIAAPCQINSEGKVQGFTKWVKSTPQGNGKNFGNEEDDLLIGVDPRESLNIISPAATPTPTYYWEQANNSMVVNYKGDATLLKGSLIKASTASNPFVPIPLFTDCAVTSAVDSTCTFDMPSRPDGAEDGPGYFIHVEEANSTQEPVTYAALGIVMSPLPAPAISDINPDTGDKNVAETVTIQGANFGEIQGTGAVTFGGQLATVLNWNDTAISVTVPTRPELNVNTPVDVTVTNALGASGTATGGYTYTVQPELATATYYTQIFDVTDQGKGPEGLVNFAAKFDGGEGQIQVSVGFFTDPAATVPFNASFVTNGDPEGYHVISNSEWNPAGSDPTEHGWSVNLANFSGASSIKTFRVRIQMSTPNIDGDPAVQPWVERLQLDYVVDVCPAEPQTIGRVQFVPQSDFIKTFPESNTVGMNIQAVLDAPVTSDLTLALSVDIQNVEGSITDPTNIFATTIPTLTIPAGSTFSNTGTIIFTANGAANGQYRVLLGGWSMADPCLELQVNTTGRLVVSGTQPGGNIALALTVQAEPGPTAPQKSADNSYPLYTLRIYTETGAAGRTPTFEQTNFVTDSQNQVTLQVPRASVPDGVYRVFLRSNRHMWKEATENGSDTVIAKLNVGDTGSYSLYFSKLILGDVTGETNGVVAPNNVVDILDIFKMVEGYGGNLISLLDFNNNSAVDITDLNITLGNYGKTGDPLP